MKTVLFFIGSLLFAFTNPLNAQNQANIWYFGNFAGLDFNSGAPVALTNGQLSTIEGCASIADASGNLRFYTDGTIVWDRNHNIMPNGTGLLGHNSSTQSAIIVPKPGSNTIYYIFTVSLPNSAGLSYSEVDMTLNGGLGDITTTKNIPLFTNTSEKVTAVLHNNNTDIWVITKENNLPNYYSYLVTNTGVNTIPVISTGGGSGLGSTGTGYMKASPNGNKIGVANQFTNIELFNFDNNTGQLSYQLSVPTSSLSPNHFGPYGIDFSPNSQVCYWTEQTSNTSIIFQIDLAAGSNTNIINSKFVVDSTNILHWGMQLGPDGKIYCADYQSKALSAINDPNNLGAACNYQDSVVFLLSGTSNIGFPTFFQSYFQDGFYSEFYCLGDSTQFTISNTSVDSVLWHFGDINSGSANISTDFVAQHVFSDTGSYNVSLVVYQGGQWTSLTQVIVITTPPVINLGPDTLVCNTTTLLLDATYPNATYLWSDNSSNSTLNVTTSGNYIVTVTTNGCSNFDSINVLFIPCLFAVDSFCYGASTQFTYNYTLADSVQWNFDDLASGANNTSNLLNPQHIFSNTGSYNVSLVVYQGGQSVSSTQTITITTPPVINLGPDTLVCNTTTLLLDATYPNATYLWSDNSSNPTLNITSSGNYIVTATTNGCSDFDSINVLFIPCIFTVDSFCYGTPTQFTYNYTLADSLQWNFDDLASGANNTSNLLDPEHTFSSAGSYNVSLTVYQDGQWMNLTQVITILSLPAINLGLDTLVCNTSTLLLDATYPNTTYLWSDNSSNPTLNVTTSGNYIVTATSNGCSSFDNINVLFIPCLFAVDSFCYGTPTQFTYNYTLADSVQWNFDDLASGTNNTSSLLNPEHIFSTSGSFDVILTVYQNNSSLQITQNIQIFASLILDLGADTSLCENESITLDAGIANTYLWNDNTTLQNILVDSAGLYSVTVSNSNCSSVDSILINYINCTLCEVSLPNAFSPNNDGVNETFVPITTGNCLFSQYRLEVYNRWGQKVYASEDINSSWDGTFQGVEQPQEVYLYLFSYKLDTGVQQQEQYTRGQVTLLR